MSARTRAPEEPSCGVLFSASFRSVWPMDPKRQTRKTSGMTTDARFIPSPSPRAQRSMHAVASPPQPVRSQYAAEGGRRSRTRGVPKSVTVGIIVRNEAAHVRETLAHVLASDFPAGGFDVVVVDGRSTDGTPAIVQEVSRSDRRVRLVTEPWDRGTHGMARNLVVDHATGEYVAFTDGDCLVDRSWLATLVRRISEERGRDPSVVAAGGPRLPAETSDWKERLLNAVMTTTLGSGGSQGFVATSRRYTDSVPNYNAIYLTEVLRTERYSDLGVGEDFELNARLVHSGRKIAFEPAAIVYHHQEGSFRSFFAQAYRYGAAQVRVFRRSGRIRWFAPVAALFALGLAVRPLLAMASAAAAWLY